MWWVWTARTRYGARRRGVGHLDDQRADAELWGYQVPALGVGPVIEVDTELPVDPERLAAMIIAAGSDEDLRGG